MKTSHFASFFAFYAVQNRILKGRRRASVVFVRRDCMTWALRRRYRLCQMRRLSSLQSCRTKDPKNCSCTAMASQIGFLYSKSISLYLDDISYGRLRF